MSVSTPQLPAQFADLERFVAFWARSSVDGRVDSRCSSSMDAISEFYDATIPRAAAMVEYLDQFPLYDMPESAGCLMRLLLALAHASIAVEIQGQPLPPQTTYPLGVKLISGVAPFG